MHRSRAAAAAGCCGFAMMAIELTAVRLLAPHFGDSAYVWTNVIGVMLAALAAGAWFGGRLSASDDPIRPLRALLLVAGGLIGAVPLVARPLAQALLPDALPLDAAMPVLVRGSLFSTTVLFAPPIWLLGAVSPLLVTALARNGVAVGRAVGAVSAAGTLGSLAGTFAATHWLVPALGCRATLWSCALLLVAVVLLLLPSPRRAPAAAMLLLLGSSLLLHGGPLRQPPRGSTLLAEVESRYQYLQVVQQGTGVGDDPRRTALQINEGLDSFHSLAIDGSVFTGGAYYDWHALAPLLAGDGLRPPALRVLSLGDAAGTFRRIHGAVHPTAVVDAVEIDAACTALGERHFPSIVAPGKVYALDGRVFAQHSTGRWHVIHVDAYAHQVYVPAHLASREFFAAARARLLPRGLLACNVGGIGFDDPVLQAIARTAREESFEVKALRIPRSRNFLLIARSGAPVEPATLPESPLGDERLSAQDLASWQALLALARDPRRWQAPGDSGVVLTDDRPVLDQLLHRSYLEIHDPRRATAPAGSEDPAGAEVLVHQARTHEDWEGVLRAAATSRQPTGYLHEMSGDARWGLRQLLAARAEYHAASKLATSLEQRQRLEHKLAGLAAELDGATAAAAAATRLGWLAAAALLAFTLAGAFVTRIASVS